MAPATFALVQKVVVGLHILGEAYMLSSVHSAAAAAGWGDTNAKSYFVHGFGLVVALAVETLLFLTPAKGSESTEEEVDESADNSTTGDESAVCDPETDPTCAAAPAAL
jgi:hypothetical protein